MRTLPLPAVTPVAGVSYRQDTVATLYQRQPLVIAAEPDNPADPHACAVLAGGQHIGYLPRALAARLRSSGDSRWVGEVAELLTGGQTRGVRVRILAPVDDTSGHSNSSHTAASDGPGAVAGSFDTPNESDGAATAAPPTPVRSRSGRSLGTLVGRDAHQVRVRTVAGQVVPYPADMVEVDAPLPA